MATSSDEIIGEVSSTSVRLRKTYSVKLGLTKKQISKHKEFSPKSYHLHKFNNDHRKHIPLNANLSTWSVRRRLKCIKGSRDDYVKHHYCDKEPTSGHAATVQLRQCFPDKRSIHRLLFRLGLRVCDVAFKNAKIVHNGLDTYFDNDKDALAYFNLLRMLLPIKPDVTKSLANETYITAMVCPIYREDLIYLRSDNVLGPLMLCTRVTNSILLLNPFTLIEKTVSADEYWNEPTAFEIYKSVKDLVEYIVLEVTRVSAGDSYSLLSDVDVARVADFGKNDIVFTTRTHLGFLKPGDHAFGYDLYAVKEDSTTMGDELKESLPDVVLVKKKYERTRTRIPLRKNISPEYEAFLKDLEKNPEALFSLSLNSEKNNNKAEKQESGVDSMVEGKESGFDLDDLLADLALVDQPDVDAAGPSDEQHR